MTYQIEMANERREIIAYMKLNSGKYLWPPASAGLTAPAGTSVTSTSEECD